MSTHDGHRGDGAGAGESSALRARLTQVEEALRASEATALEAQAARDRFLAVLSHELRTSLTTVLGMNQLLLQSSLTPAQRASVTASQNASNALLSLVNELLDLAKIEAGRFALVPEVFALRTSLTETCELLRPRADRAGLVLHLDVAPSVPETVIGDPVRVRQVLNNYLSNALKFTSQGGVLVAASAQPHERGVLLRVEVYDSGIGIEREALERLFEPFSQVGAGRAGTGLGLAIARQLARLMGGDAGARSEPGRGSVFWFTAVLERSTGSAPQRKSSYMGIDAVSLAAATGGGREPSESSPAVLVVEDNDVNRFMLQNLVNGLGYRAVGAASGPEALERAKAERWAAILMDWHLGTWDGLEVTRRIREHEAKTNAPRVPVIAVTASALRGDRDKCLAAGMDDYLSKPVSVKRLGEVLNVWAPLETQSPRAASSTSAPPDPQSVTGRGVVDMAQLRAWTGLSASNDPALFRRLVDLFANDGRTRVEALQNAFESEDERALVREAHALRGACATVCALRASALAGWLEANETRANRGLEAALVSALGRAVEDAISTLETVKA